MDRPAARLALRRLLAACRTEVFSGVATSGMLPAIGKLAGRRAGAEAILAQVAGF